MARNINKNTKILCAKPCPKLYYSFGNKIQQLPEHSFARTEMPSKKGVCYTILRVINKGLAQYRS